MCESIDLQKVSTFNAKKHIVMQPFWFFSQPTFLFFPNCSTFGRYRGYEILGGLDRWRGLGFIFIKFESLEVTYPLIFEGVDVNDVCVFI